MGSRRHHFSDLFRTSADRAGRATRDFLDGDDATAVPERSAYALVDAAASWLVHGGGEETARLALEAVTTPAVAGDVLRALAGNR
jgi:hypothetical protein